MKSFKRFIHLTEAKKKDVLSLYPHVGNFGLPDKHITKYGMHLGKITDESHDPKTIKSTLEDFDKNQNSLPADKRDFTKYNSIGEVNDALTPVKAKAASKKDITPLEKVGKWEIRKVGSKNACIKTYGGGKTNWCVAASGTNNRFDDYSNSGKNVMYTIHNTETPEEYYAYHEGEKGKIQRRNQENGAVDLEKFIKDKPELKNSKVINNSKWGFLTNPTAENIHRALNDNSDYVRAAAAKHPNATHEQIGRALNDKEWRVRAAAAENPNATSEHIHRALSDESDHVRAAAAEHPNATSEHIHRALSDESDNVRAIAAEHPNVTSEHIDRALDDENLYVRLSSALNKNATSEHIHRALNDKEWRVRAAAAENPNATHEHISRALDDEDLYVRSSSVLNKNATHEHISRSLDDKEWRVRAAAVKNPNATHEHISRALDDEDLYVRSAAAEHPNTTHEHISRALDDKEWTVRAAAVKNPNATSEHFNRALNDGNKNVIKEAKKRLKTLKESNETYIDLSKKREEKQLKSFHKKKYGLKSVE